VVAVIQIGAGVCQEYYGWEAGLALAFLDLTLLWFLTIRRKPVILAASGKAEQAPAAIQD
jgi:hypothetical protein